MWMGTQSARMEKAAQEEKQRKIEVSKKRPPSAPAAPDGPDTKRMKLEDAAMSATFLAGFDFTKLPAALVTDLIVANLQTFPEEVLDGLVQIYRQGKAASQLQAVPGPSTPASTALGSVAESSIAPAGAFDASLTRSETAASESVIFVRESAGRSSRSRSRSRTPPLSPPTKEEDPVDPLQMDIEEEELEYEPDKLNLEVS